MPRVRAELQASHQATLALATRQGLNPKTVAKWRKRTVTAARPVGPSRPRGTVLSETEEATVVAFRRRSLLPLDDVLVCLRATVPKLARSARHRCLVRHGIFCLPQGEEEKASKRKPCAETMIGYVHLGVGELHLADGKLLMLLAIARAAKFTHLAVLDATTIDHSAVDPSPQARAPSSARGAWCSPTRPSTAAAIRRSRRS